MPSILAISSRPLESVDFGHITVPTRCRWSFASTLPVIIIVIMHIFSCAAAVVCAIPLVLATPMPYGSTSGPDASNGAMRSLRPRHITARAPKSLLPISLAAKKCDNSRECGELHGQCKAAIARIDVKAVYSKPTTFTSLIPGPEKKGGCAVSLACKDNNFGAGITGQQVALL